MEKFHRQVDLPEEFALPEDFDIEVASDPSKEEKDVVYAGSIENWSTLELSEKAKARPYIAGIVISSWTISVIACALRLLITGNLIVTVPPVLLSVPLYIVLRYYFNDG